MSSKRHILPVLLIAFAGVLATAPMAAAKSTPPGGGPPTIYMGPYSTSAQCETVRTELGTNAITQCIDYSSDPNGPGGGPQPGYYFQAYFN